MVILSSRSKALHNSFFSRLAEVCAFSLWSWSSVGIGNIIIGLEKIAGTYWMSYPHGYRGQQCDSWSSVGCSHWLIWRPIRPWLGWLRVHCFCIGGEDNLFCLSRCRPSDWVVPDFLIGGFLSKFLGPDDISVFPQKVRKGSHFGEIGQRRKRRV